MNAVEDVPWWQMELRSLIVVVVDVVDDVVVVDVVDDFVDDVVGAVAGGAVASAVGPSEFYYLATNVVEV